MTKAMKRPLLVFVYGAGRLTRESSPPLKLEYTTCIKNVVEATQMFRENFWFHAHIFMKGQSANRKCYVAKSSRC
jgi:hypothetical protein